MRTREECSRCGAEARVVRGDYKMRSSELRNVVLRGIEIIKCDSCGNEDPLIPRMEELLRTMARTVLVKPYRLMGDEVRFLRKFLGLAGEQFARLLHIDKSTLSRWENDEDPVGAQSDLLIRSLVIILAGFSDMRDTAAGFDQIHDRRRHLALEVNAATMACEYQQ